MIKVRIAKGIKLREENFGGIAFYNDNFLMLGKDAFQFLNKLQTINKFIHVDANDPLIKKLINLKLLYIKR